jgi:hypothetical protein
MIKDTGPDNAATDHDRTRMRFHLAITHTLLTRWTL